MIAETRYNM